MKKKRSLTFKGEFVDNLDWEKAEVFRLLKNQPGTQYQEADENAKEQILTWVKSLLHNSVFSIHFVKSDGTVRDMRCTVDASKVLMPSVKQPIAAAVGIVASATVNIDGLAESKKPRKEPDPVNQRVYDMDLNEWRSFRYDRLQKISVEINFTK